MTARAEPRYMGGQAVMEGVMMRGADAWAVALRTPEGAIEVEVRPVPGWTERWRHVPLLRGVIGMAESLALGYRALTLSANRQMPEDEQLSEKAVGWTMGIALVVFSALFIVLPALLGKGVGRFADFMSFQLAEGLARLALFIGYLALVGLMRDIRRVFQYHGAEHKVIAAYENGADLTPESADRFTTAHVRCGTNFLLIVMVVAIFTYSLVPTPDLWLIIASRVVLIPVIAGLSYELIRLAARNMHRPWVRLLMRPGLLLQRLTTRRPDLDQLEVAVAALQAVLPTEPLAEAETDPTPQSHAPAW